ncbi:aminomethyl-transferring glycine dehydrogenase [Bacteroidia bacterium]|nr:aminomethyl-transferring glycine dehydrogenase [Bacteroidia bacterium]MDC0561001.1 aminomethyl-transferring glycine dehydrogenase [Bacteroidia bacterium]
MYKEHFSDRHNSIKSHEENEMLSLLGYDQMEQLISDTIPSEIRLKNDLNLDDPLTEVELLTKLKSIGEKNQISKNYIGMGYYGTHTPKVILRNILENPGWYTQYTPYQAEIAQGRLEALLNFQTMIMDLTGMEIANASLLDEATAAAEAMAMVFSAKGKKSGNKFFVSDKAFPQTIDVIETRAEPLGITVVIGNPYNVDFNEDFFGLFVQYPNGEGSVEDYANLVAKALEHNVKTVVAADILSLTLLEAPGTWGAEVVVGSTQRFGIPMGNGGPHAAYFATKEQHKRRLPGRVIGVSQDSNGNTALRMALQTREQHIKRDKATSNICTAQALLAVMAGMYAAYHGPKRLKQIATKVNQLTSILANNLVKIGFDLKNNSAFDTLAILLDENEQSKLKNILAQHKINLRYEPTFVGVSIDETTEFEDIKLLIDLFAELKSVEVSFEQKVSQMWDLNLDRNTPYLEHPVFNSYHTEHEMLRYLKSLENKDLSLAHSMIALGSCTMKLNATTEMIPVTWEAFGNIHPFAPKEQLSGYTELLHDLERDLSEITGFHKVSLQPNAGAQGEYTGLMTIREYFKDTNQGHRNIVIIPESAHGTNPASAVMAGMKVVVVKCHENGYIDLVDLREKVASNKDTLAAAMITYPSTNGVYEETIKEVTSLIHEFGGQVYMDGANMNAQVGYTNPANIGADVCHLNLHKTFCIPHGGGGPGMGPIGVAEHLSPYLPGHSVVSGVSTDKAMRAVSAAPFGSASILLISYAYIKMMGGEGLKKATATAILNANYMKYRLSKGYDVLYTGQKGTVAHEMVVDPRPLKITSGVLVEDIAKRLIDYGFHAPTVSFPIPGTLMIEPTESESKSELDRFCDALLAIREEIAEIESGKVDKDNNVIKHAPHTAQLVSGDNWDRPYSRTKAAYPASYVIENKFWPSVGRVDNTYGDRNLVCSCLPVSDYIEV